ncbi:MAG: hypothetical protein JW395_1032 [Nitrospira sp.]|nr:hypothetical protein [Nitrospira sp.]
MQRGVHEGAAAPLPGASGGVPRKAKCPRVGKRPTPEFRPSNPSLDLHFPSPMSIITAN